MLRHLSPPVRIALPHQIRPIPEGAAKALRRTRIFRILFESARASESHSSQGASDVRLSSLKRECGADGTCTDGLCLFRDLIGQGFKEVPIASRGLRVGHRL